MPKLHVVDGSGYIFRAYWAIRNLTNPRGEPVNAIHGFANMLEKLLRDETPSHLCLVFDADAHTFRSDLHPEYKANRSPPPEDLIAQVPRIHEVADAFGIRRFVVDGVEADDVIATLTRMGREAGFEVRLISGDKDLMQLVGDGVTLFEPMKGELFDAAGVEKKLGVPPRQVRDLLTLAGDSSDNIPGVKGVGVKTAAKYLAQFGDVAGVLRAAKNGEIKGKTGATVAASDDEVALSSKLVTLVDDVDLAVESVEDLSYPGPDRDTVRAFYARMQLEQLLQRWTDAEGEEVAEPQELGLGQMEPPSPAELDRDLAGWLARREGALTVVFEADTGRAVDAKLIGVELSRGGDRVYVPVGHDDGGADEGKVLDALRPLLEDPSVSKRSANAKLVTGMALARGIVVKGWTFDSGLASYLFDPDQSAHDPRGIGERFFGLDVADRTRLLRKDRKRRPLSAAEPSGMLPYAGEVLAVVDASAERMPESLEEHGLSSVLEDVELPLVSVLARMELAGIRVDGERLAQLGEVFSVELERLEAACFEAAGKSFNLGSPKQLEEILFQDLELKIKKRTATGRPSTDASVLEQLVDDHPLPAAILEHRKISKLQSTYVDALPKMIVPQTGRVHTQLSQVTAATGRLSSLEPNLQNIPIRSDIGRQLRTVFVAEPGHRLISVDYSQVELRVLAHLSGEELLAKAFADVADVHTRTAAALFRVRPDEVTREQRTQAKAVNFGVLYGMGAVRLARELDIERRLAKQFIDDYFERQPRVRAFIESNLEQARSSGEVRTILGRRRRVTDLNAKSRAARQAAERVATNTPIQGSAADLIKLAMLRVDAELRAAHPRARLLLQVHDELLVEAPAEEAADVASLVQSLMQTVYPLDVPLTAEPHVGESWDEAH